MPYLFDTDAISEVLKKRPAAPYLAWLGGISREEQYTSAVSIGELFKGAFRSPAREKHLANIEARILPAITVLPYDVSIARVYGRIEAALVESGQPLADADLQIAAAALYHGLELVTGNVRHFERIPGLRIQRALADTRVSG